MKNGLRNKKQQGIDKMQGIELDETNEGLSRIYFLTLVLIFIVVCGGVAVVILPPHTELASLREELEAKREQVARAKEREKQAREHLKWIEDPEYAEQIARDEANQARRGEVIIRVEPVEPVKPDEPKNAGAEPR